MMSTVGTTRANTRSSSGRDKPASKSNTHNTNHTTVQPGKQNVQPTAEQLRMAQMIDSDDPETLAKIQQVQDVTGKTQDEVMVALHDHDDDPEKAINFLFENEDADQGQWETTGRKKKGRNQPAIQRVEPTSTPTKDKIRDKERDKDRGSRERENKEKDNRNGSSSRGRGRGRDRDRDGPPPRLRGRGKENGSVSERNERNRQNGEFGGRGRGSRDRDDRWNREDNRPGGRYGQMNGPSRRGRAGPRMGTFNSSDYKGTREFVNSKLDEISVWTNPPESTVTPNTTTETGTWGDVVQKTEEWSVEGDWGGDLSESKVFTPSIGPPTASQPPKPAIPEQPPNLSGSIDIATLLQKPTEQTTLSAGDGMTSSRLGQFADIKPQTMSEPSKTPVGLVTQSQSLGPQSLGPTTVGTSPSIGPVSLSSIMAVGTTPVGSSAGMVQSQRGQQQAKPPKKKMPPPSKIPASAVEMPMSAYSTSMGSLDVQFGALEFGSDVGDFSSTNDSVATCSAPSLMSSSTVSSVSEVSSGSSHLSSFSSKPSDTYDGSLMSSSMMASTSVTMTTTSPIVSSLEQSSMPTYSQTSSTSQSKPLPADSLSLPPQSGLGQSSSLMGTGQRISQQAALDAVRSGSATSSPSPMTSSMTVPQTGPPSLSSTVPTPSSLSSLSSHSHSSNLPSTMPSASSGLMSSSLSSHHSALSPSSHTGLGSTSQGLGPSSHQPTYSSTATLPSHSSSGLSGSDVTGSSHPGHGSVQSSPMAAGKLSGGLGGVKDSHLDSHVHQGQSTLTTLSSSSLGSGPSSHSAASSYSAPSATSAVTMSSTVSAALGFSTTTTSATSTKATTQSTSSSKSALNLPPGMPPLLNQLAAGHQYITMAPGLLPAYHQPMYNYEDLQLLQRMPMGYPYDMQQFQPNTTLTTDRSGASIGNVQYSVTEANKFSRTDASSPIVTSVASQQQQQQQQQPGQGSHHQQQQTQQQAFLNPTQLPPGYGYGGLAYYPGAASVVPGMQYGPAMFPTVGTVPPSTRSQGSSAPHSGFQQPGAYGQHGSHGGYGTGYDDLTQTADFSKGGYQAASQSQSKGTGASGKISGTSSTSATSDMSGSVYGSKTHTQTYDKQGFHAGTPPPFNIPLASGSQGGTLNPATGYATSPAQYVPMMAHPHQHQHQHHSPMLPHQLHGDAPQTGSSQRSQGASSQAKQAGSKQSYSSPYWGAN